MQLGSSALHLGRRDLDVFIAGVERPVKTANRRLPQQGGPAERSLGSRCATQSRRNCAIHLTGNLEQRGLLFGKQGFGHQSIKGDDCVMAP